MRPRAFTLTARTDAGVHADIALATCWLPAGTPFPLDAERARPDGLGATVVRRVHPSVYARGLASAKRYVYLVRDEADAADPPWERGEHTPGPAGGQRRWRIRERLDVDAMRRAASHLVGTHDFTALRGPGGHTASPDKSLERLDLERTADGIRLTLEADAFLRKMVRNVASLLVAVGRGERAADEVPGILASKNPRRGAWPAPPHGLALAGLRVDPARIGADGTASWWTNPAALTEHRAVASSSATPPTAPPRSTAG